METKEKNGQRQKGNKEQNAYNPATDRRVVYTKTHTLPKPVGDKAKQTGENRQTDDKTNPADDKAKQTDYKNQTDI